MIFPGEAQFEVPGCQSRRGKLRRTFITGAFKLLLNDLGDGLVLVNLVLAAHGKQPQPGYQHRLVVVQVEGALSHLLKLGQNAVDLAQLALPFYSQKGRPAQDIIQIDIRFFRCQLDLEPERLRDLLVPQEADHPEGVG